MTRTKTLLVVIALGVALAAVGIFGVIGVLHRIEDGRRTATTLVCAALSGVSEGGRAVITAGTKGPETPFTRRLEQFGYPSLSIRRRQAHAAATAYVDDIASRVEASLGRRGVRLVRRDGTLDCHEFLRLANVK